MQKSEVRPTILLVDDSQEVLDRTKDYLEHQGYEVVSVKDAFSASVLIRQYRPSLVVLDVEMPLSGDILARLLERFHCTPIIYYSAIDEDRGRALAASSKDATFVSKAIGLRALGREVARRLIVVPEAAP